MKSNIPHVLILALFLTGCSASSSTAKNEKRAAEYEQTAALIEGGSYEFTVRSANPAGGRTIQITSTYSLEVREGVYKAYLPYFGRAYSASYGGNGGVEFEGEPRELKIEKEDSKQKVTVRFRIKHQDEDLECMLVITSSGSGTLTVSSSKRQPISYYGAISK